MFIQHAVLLAVPIYVVVQMLSSFSVRTEVLLVQIMRSINGPYKEAFLSLFSWEPSVLSAGCKIFVKTSVTQEGYNCQLP